MIFKPPSNSKNSPAFCEVQTCLLLEINNGVTAANMDEIRTDEEATKAPGMEKTEESLKSLEKKYEDVLEKHKEYLVSELTIFIFIRPFFFLFLSIPLVLFFLLLLSFYSSFSFIVCFTII